jgi:predicted DNA binding CopG/RHH family protein
MVYTKVIMPDDLHRAVKTRATLKGVYFKDYLLEIIEKGLKTDRKETGEHHI